MSESYAPRGGHPIPTEGRCDVPRGEPWQLQVTVPVGRRIRYELADHRLGHAVDDLRAAVVGVSDVACAVTKD
jgi:hypothetical protein